ncbi:MAG: hypothetical protein ACR2P4_02000 [Gammaproteobacteria bacterium]
MDSRFRGNDEGDVVCRAFARAGRVLAACADNGIRQRSNPCAVRRAPCAVRRAPCNAKHAFVHVRLCHHRHNSRDYTHNIRPVKHFFHLCAFLAFSPFPSLPRKRESAGGEAAANVKCQTCP